MFYLVSNLLETQIIESTTRPEFEDGLKQAKNGKRWSSLGHGFETREELIEYYGILDCGCKICGQIVSSHFHEPTKSEIIKDNLCFSCNLWVKRAKSLKENQMIIGNNFYTIGTESRDNTNLGGLNKFRGFGGRKFVFTKNDGTEVTSTNVWCGGEIPEHLKHMFPDNAKLSLIGTFI